LKLVIRKCDLKRETFRGSGPGGQNVNKTESCVRLTHIPTGIKAEGRTERSQRANEEACLKLLIAKLYRHFREAALAAEDSRNAAKPSASFGHQIRTYWLCGHQRVVDHRTGKEAPPSTVLNGGFECLTRS
jgi:peptide chain release factor 2